VAAVVGSVTSSVEGSKKRIPFGSVEPAVLVVLKRLDPLICVFTLLLCALAFDEKLTPAIAAVAMLALVLSNHMLTRPNRDSELAGELLTTVFARIVFEWACVVGVLLFAAFAFKVTSLFSRAMMLTWFVATPLALQAGHALRRRVRWLITNSGYTPKYLIIGANSIGFELFRRLPQRGFLGFFDFRGADRVAQIIDPAQLVGHCNDVADFVRKQSVTSVYIALPLSNVPRISELMSALRDTTASVYFVPDVFAFDLIQGRLVEINGMPVLSVCDTPFHGMDAVLKRFTDMTLACVGLAIAAVPMLCIALAIKLTSKGPVLFRQRRYGLNGEEIMVYKFRSMTVCEDGAVVTQARREDCRITPLGRILRKTSLDELPQLLNVITGQMSLVGPRPHAVAHNELYRKLISGYMIRHKVRPGITGLAQVNGLRGETADVATMRERVRFDLEYLSHWSPWLDLKIILKTVWVVLRTRNAY